MLATLKTFVQVVATPVHLKRTLLIAQQACLPVLNIGYAALQGWRDWVALKREELERGAVPSPRKPTTPAGARIELADLRERVRKLEAIASGVDL